MFTEERKKLEESMKCSTVFSSPYESLQQHKADPMEINNFARIKLTWLKSLIVSPAYCQILFFSFHKEKFKEIR